MQIRCEPDLLSSTKPSELTQMLQEGFYVIWWTAALPGRPIQETHQLTIRLHLPSNEEVKAWDAAGCRKQTYEMSL